MKPACLAEFGNRVDVCIGPTSVYITPPHAPNGLGGVAFPVLWVDLFCHVKSIFGLDRFYAIDSRCFLALVFLCHPSHCEQPRRLGLHQQLLKFVNCSAITTLIGSVYSFLNAVDMLLELAPGQHAPSLTGRLNRFPAILPCFPLCHPTHSIPSIQQDPRLRIRELSSRRWLLGSSFHRERWLAPTHRIDHR